MSLFTQNHRRFIGALVVIVVAAIGTILLRGSHAASPYASTEAEAGTLSGSAVVQTNGSVASGGAYVRFGTALGTLGACTTSAATGAGSPSETFAVAAPSSGDSASEIQSKVNTASSAGGGIVTLQKGTYTIDSPITVASNVQLSGQGEGETILKAGVKNISVITTNGNSNITLSDFTADASGNTLSDSNETGDYTINIPNSTNVIVQNVATIDPFSYAIVPDDATKFCIRNDNVQIDTSGKYTSLDGIHVEGSTYGDVVDNYVDNRVGGADGGDDGLVAQGYMSNESYITYKGNVVRGGNSGDCMQFALGPGNISHDVIEANEFYGCPFGIRTGGYASSGTITNITIDNNNIHNLVPGDSSGAFPSGGNAIALGGYLDSGQSASNNVISNNSICSAGSIVPEGGTTISNTVTYTGCTDAPTTTAPPPTIP